MRPCLTTSSRALTLVVTTCLLLVSMTVSAQAQETAQAESLFEALNTSLSLDQRVAIFLEARKDRYLTTQDIEQVRSATYQAEDALWQVFEEIGEPPAPPPKDKSFKNYDGDALVYADSPGPTRSEASLELSQEQKLITGLYTFLETRARRELIAYLARKIGKELCEDGEMASFFVASCALLAHRKFNLVDGLHQVAREDLEHLPERLADFILARKLEELEPIACLLSTTQQGIALAQREDRSLRAYIESWVTLATHPHCQAWMSRPNVSKGPMETLVWLKLMMEDEDYLVSLAELETTLVSQLEEAMWARLTRQHEALWRATSVSYGDVQRRFPSGIAARLAKIDEYITRLSEQDESAARDAKLEAWLDNRARLRDAAKAYERARQGAVKAYREDVMARFQATIEQRDLPRLIASVREFSRLLRADSVSELARAPAARLEVALTLVAIVTTLFFEQLENERVEALVEELGQALPLLFAGEYLQAMTHLSRSETLQREDLSPLPEVLQSALLMASFAEAKSSQEVVAILEREAMPQGSWVIKRVEPTLSLSAYFGFQVSRETLLPTTNGDDAAWTFGGDVPLGLEYSWPTESYGSWGVMAQIVDLGAISTARFVGSDDVRQTLVEPEVGFVQLLAPGVRLSYGFRDAPIALGLRADVVPALRQGLDASFTRTRAHTVFRTGLTLGVDLPLLIF